MKLLRHPRSARAKFYERMKIKSRWRVTIPDLDFIFAKLFHKINCTRAELLMTSYDYQTRPATRWKPLTKHIRSITLSKNVHAHHQLIDEIREEKLAIIMHWCIKLCTFKLARGLIGPVAVNLKPLRALHDSVGKGVKFW